MTKTIDSGPLFRLDGRVALITGASSGLGTRCARVLHAAGAAVVLAARRKDRIELWPVSSIGRWPWPATYPCRPTSRG